MQGFNWDSLGLGGPALPTLWPHLKALTLNFVAQQQGTGPDLRQLEEDLGLIVPGLRHFLRLTHLDLCGNPLFKGARAGVTGQEGAPSLAASSGALVHLAYLNLSRTELEDVTADVLSGSFRHLRCLMHLDLSDNSIAMRDGSQQLAANLTGLAALKTLILSGNLIGDEGASALLPRLLQLGQLRQLDLGSNCIEDSGATPLRAVLNTWAIHWSAWT